MAARLDAAADLHLEIDGIDAHLVGSGSRLQLHVDHPVHVYRQVRQTFAFARSRSSIAAVARYLDDAGLTVDVVRADTQLFTIGAGQRSRLGALAVGSRRITPGPSRALAHALVTAAGSWLRTKRRRRR